MPHLECPAPHFPLSCQKPFPLYAGVTDTPYDALEESSVPPTADRPRAQLKPRTRGAKNPKCHDMCPAEERQQRTVERQLHPYERPGPDEYVTTAELAVKKYQRSRK